MENDFLGVVGRSSQMFCLGWCYIAVEMVLGPVIFVERLDFALVMIFEMYCFMVFLLRLLSFPDSVFGTNY